MSRLEAILRSTDHTVEQKFLELTWILKKKIDILRVHIRFNNIAEDNSET